MKLEILLLLLLFLRTRESICPGIKPLKFEFFELRNRTSR